MLVKLLLFLIPVSAMAESASLSDFLTVAWENSPAIRAERFQDEASEQFVSSVRGRYYPHVTLQALDTTGFPASNSGLQIGGLMGSPFRSGLAGGVVVEQTIYDFGRTQALLEQARASRSLDQAKLSEDKYRFLFAAGQLYLACARAHSVQKVDTALMEWATINLKETSRFTKTGQRSVIDNSLVQAEVNRLKLDLDQMQKYERSLIEQMKIFGGKQGCKDLSETWQVKIPSNLRVEEPSLLIAKARLEIAKSAFEEAKDAELPSLKAVASAGEMENDRLVGKKENYAAGVGLTVPVWNGGEDAHREQGLKSQAEFQIEKLKAAELEYASKLKGLQDEFSRDREALIVLEKNLEQVEKTIRLASKRYSSLEGPLIDVREAFKQLREMSLQRLQIMSQLSGSALQLGMLQSTGVKNEQR